MSASAKITFGLFPPSSNEVRLVPADNPYSPLTLIRPRTPDVQYEVDSAHDSLWILTNDDHVNFRIASADPGSPGQWTTVVAGSGETRIVVEDPSTV